MIAVRCLDGARRGMSIGRKGVGNAGAAEFHVPKPCFYKRFSSADATAAFHEQRVLRTDADPQNAAVSRIPIR